MKFQLKSIGLVLFSLAMAGCGVKVADGPLDLTAANVAGTYLNPCVSSAEPGASSMRYVFVLGADSKYRDGNRYFTDSACKTPLASKPEVLGLVEAWTLRELVDSSAKIYNYDYTIAGVTYYDIVQIQRLNGSVQLFHGDGDRQTETRNRPKAFSKTTLVKE